MDYLESPAKSSLTNGADVSNPADVGLLVSVTSIAEAKVAARFPLAIIDFKNPTRGALGRCSEEVLNQIETFNRADVYFSAACGELRDWVSAEYTLPAGFRFAKAGPAGITDSEDLLHALLRFRADQRDEVQPVAVAYADHQLASSMRVEQIIQLAAKAQYQWFLLDTMTKNGRRLLDWISTERLGHIIALCRENGLRCVLAGSVSLQDMSQLIALKPDLLGIRGAVCKTDRTSAIDPAKIQLWCDAMQAEQPTDNLLPSK